MSELEYDRKITWHEKNEDGTKTGRTITVIWNGVKRFAGISQCSSKDHFNRKIGHVMSTARAEHLLAVETGQKQERHILDENGDPIGITREEENTQKGLMDVFTIDNIPSHIPEWMCLPKEE